MIVLPFFLVIWFSPMALFSSRLRNQKRPMTIRNSLIAVGVIAVGLALLQSGPCVQGAMGLLVLYVTPFVFAALYLPKGWDVMIALSWSLGTLMLLLTILGSAKL